MTDLNMNNRLLGFKEENSKTSDVIIYIALKNIS